MTPEQALHVALGEPWPPLLVYVDGMAARYPEHVAVVEALFLHMAPPGRVADASPIVAEFQDPGEPLVCRANNTVDPRERFRGREVCLEMKTGNRAFFFGKDEFGRAALAQFLLDNPYLRQKTDVVSDNHKITAKIGHSYTPGQGQTCSVAPSRLSDNGGTA